MEEFKLRVIYLPANPPSPVPEESEEGSPTREDGNDQASSASAVIACIHKSFNHLAQFSTRLKVECYC